MRQRSGWIGGALVLGLCLAFGQAQAQDTAKPLLQHTFEENAGDWQVIDILNSMSGSGKLSVTHEAANVKSGKGALQWDYAVEKGQMWGLMLPTPDGALTKMKSLKFWVKSDHAASLVLALSEKEGGRYNAIFAVPADKWQEVQLAPSDFYLSDDPNDPKDPDGKLDLDKVENVSLLDLSGFLAQGDNAQIDQIFNIQRGAHKTYLDDFTVTTEPLTGVAPMGKDVALDELSRPQVGWMIMGDMRASTTTGKPLSGASLKLEMHQGPMKIHGAIRRFASGKLEGKGQVAFTIAALKPTKLIVQLEQPNGKFNTTIDVPGGSELKEFWLPFSDFTVADDSPDKSAKLDPAKIHQILFLDINGFTDMTDQDNTLWINKLRGASK
ncbi:MAG TPA: hypothetical protein VKU00_32655 [Chthonomonadaceae bacterium]|nr:hypothetical protein [Chthonomonadaceae bacterium]